MHAVSVIKPNLSPISVFRRLSSAKLKVHHSPECSTSPIWRLNKRTWLSSHDKQISKVTGSRVLSGVNVSQVCGEDDSKDEEALEVVSEVEAYIISIRKILSSIGDGQTSVSPYDTAFVALIKDVNGHDLPQFPSSLDWISKNQLSDGSWGDEHYFGACDRMLCTLACVIALRSWSVYPDKSDKGISFIKENVSKLENTNAELMTCGFELIFPALVQRARNMGIEDIPYDSPVMEEIYAVRDQKMKRVPREVMHSVPTTLLFNLEGFENLDWKKLLKLQCKDGSFLTSPSSTAFAFMETKDENCLKFINYVVEKFNGGAPHSYPGDIFARLWAVDRLQRLGISRYFESEIEDCLSYVHRFWTEKGVWSARDTGFSDIDDTSMGFRLLRLHGYNIDPSMYSKYWLQVSHLLVLLMDVLVHFKMENTFFCHAGHMTESPTPIYSLYRASQLLFPGEKILEEAKDFSYNFLRERVATNQLQDKWVVSKHLPDEIRIGLEIPWYSCLPRVETRYYLEHYGGADEVWNGKTLNRMYDISNNTYLNFGKLDFNICQAQHQIDWTSMQEWCESICSVEEFGISRKDILIAYFLATASIFEPERSTERIAWAKSQIISKMIISFYNKETTSMDQKVAFQTNFSINNNGSGITNSDERVHQGHIPIPLDALRQFLEGFEGSISRQLKNVWGVWLKKLVHNEMGNDAELLATTLNICAGHASIEEIISHHEYKSLSNLTNKICCWLNDYQNKKVNITNSNIKDMDIIEQDMQTLVKLVLEESDGINRNIKHTFLLVAKTYYYIAYTDAEKIDMHILDVLIQPIV